MQIPAMDRNADQFETKILIFQKPLQQREKRKLLPEEWDPRLATRYDMSFYNLHPTLLQPSK